MIAGVWLKSRKAAKSLQFPTPEGDRVIELRDASTKTSWCAMSRDLYFTLLVSQEL